MASTISKINKQKPGLLTITRPEPNPKPKSAICHALVIIMSTVELMKMMRFQLRMKVCCGNECKPACSTTGGGNLPQLLLTQLQLLLLPRLLLPACYKTGGWTLDTPAASPDPLPHLCALLCFARHHLSFFEAAYLSLLQLHN